MRFVFHGSQERFAFGVSDLAAGTELSSIDGLVDEAALGCDTAEGAG